MTHKVHSILLALVVIKFHAYERLGIWGSSSVMPSSSWLYPLGIQNCFVVFFIAKRSPQKLRVYVMFRGLTYC